MNSYDENDMIVFIQTNAETEDIKNLDNDDLLYLADLVEEYLEDKGFLDDEEVDFDLYEKLVTGEDTDMYDFIIENIKRDEFEDFSLSLDAFVEFMELQDDYYDTLDDEEDDEE